MDSLHPDSDSLKQCTGPCGRLLPASLEFFHRGPKGGLRPQCKQCRIAYSKQYVAAHREQTAAYQKCYAETHQAELAAYKKAYAALHQEEQKARARRYYQEHRRQIAAYGIGYREAHSPEKRERDRKYRLAHQGEIRARDRQYKAARRASLAAASREYYEAHRDEKLAYAKRYIQTPRGIIAKRTGSHNRRARKKHAPGSHTTDELRQQFLRQGGTCYYCQKKLSHARDSWNADHLVPLSRGGTNDISNVVITCPTCNRKKHDKLPHEWPDGGRLL